MYYFNALIKQYLLHLISITYIKPHFQHEPYSEAELGGYQEKVEKSSADW